jgi:hypothetical protein
MLEASTKLGPYEIVASLGAGGMGEVYRDRDTRLGREVAVKVLPEPFATNPDRQGRFEREARAVAALSHPNILALYDYGTQGAVTYAVMELLEGETLRARLTKGPLPWREAVEIGAAVARPGKVRRRAREKDERRRAEMRHPARQKDPCRGRVEVGRIHQQAVRPDGADEVLYPQSPSDATTALPLAEPQQGLRPVRREWPLAGCLGRVG